MLAVSISCVATRELVCKDFCVEKEEALVKRAAHLMVTSLAGSLALVTCREPLRVSLTQHLRQLLQPATHNKDDADLVSSSSITFSPPSPFYWIDYSYN